MTFTQQVKEELIKLPLGDKCCCISESMGMLFYSRMFTVERIYMQCENIGVIKRACDIFYAAFGRMPQVNDDMAIIIEDTAFIKEIYSAYGFDYKNLPLQLNRAVIEEDCCKSAFLRGAFLLGGYSSVSGKGYHLELVTTHYNISRQVLSLLLDINIPAGSVIRRGNYVVYSKNSNVIEDFLSAMGATNSSLNLMLEKVEKDLRNNVNRKVNCDTANLDKTISAAAKQISAIKRLEKTALFEELSPQMRETARLRIENPELSLAELCTLFKEPVSKPGLNNRLRKLVRMAEAEGENA